MKRKISLLLAIAITCSAYLSCSPSLAADYSGAIGGFKTSPKAEYSAAYFSDLDENDWYGTNMQGVVRDAYELQVMTGKGGDIYDPSGTLTLGEAIKMASCVYSVYTGGSAADFVQGTPWYQVFVEYAISNNIINAWDFDDYTRNATKAEVAYIFSSCIPESELAAINSVDSLPDVDEYSSQYGGDIYKLYRAGVLTGNDSSGTFGYSANIARSEAAAIIVRVILPSQRRWVDFSTKHVLEDYLGRDFEAIKYNFGDSDPSYAADIHGYFDWRYSYRGVYIGGFVDGFSGNRLVGSILVDLREVENRSSYYLYSMDGNSSYASIKSTLGTPIYEDNSGIQGTSYALSYCVDFETERYAKFYFDSNYSLIGLHAFYPN